MRIISLIAACAAACAAAAAVAACGSSTTKTVAETTTGSPSSASTPTTATATATAGGQSSTSATTTSATTTSAAGVPRCRAAVLALSFLGQQGAVGHGVIGFALRNTGSTSCQTFGYPGVLWLGKSGAPLPTDDVRTTRDFFGAAPLASLTVAPGSQISFRLGVTHGAGGTAGCATAAALQVIPPNDTSTLRITIPNGVFECKTTTVTPVRPGTSAYQL